VETAQRRTKNELLFREINEGIGEVAEHSRVVQSSPVVFVCECSQVDCTTALELTLEEYRGVRREVTYFLVAPGHANPDRERVVEENPRYAVVEKVRAAGSTARADARA
jgi:hypothetical protein